MFKSVLTVASVFFLSAIGHAEPVCLGETLEWQDHHWVYTTLEGVERDVCTQCDGEWVAVPEWVAGFEALCPQDGWEPAPVASHPVFALFVETFVGPGVAVMRPAYDWDDCQHLILRCPKTTGC